MFQITKVYLWAAQHMSRRSLTTTVLQTVIACVVAACGSVDGFEESGAVDSQASALAYDAKYYHMDFGSSFPGFGDQWVIYDAPSLYRSTWQISSGRLRQTGNFYTGSATSTVPDKLGTAAIQTSSVFAGDVTVDVLATSPDNDAVGLYLRYIDRDNYYRVSIDRQRRYFRIVKRVNGTTTTLREYTDVDVDLTSWKKLSFWIAGDELGAFSAGVCGGRCAEAVLITSDPDPLPGGHVGIYSWGMSDVSFDELQVSATPPLDKYIRFDSLDSNWAIYDPPNPLNGPSNWSVSGGKLRSYSNIYTNPTSATEIEKLGTRVILENQNYFGDVGVSMQVSSTDDDASGLFLRYKDGDNYYRASIDKQRKYFRIVRRKDGVSTLLAEITNTTVNYQQSALFEFFIVENQLTAYWRDASGREMTLTAIDKNQWRDGDVGVYSWGSYGLSVDDFKVYYSRFMPHISSWADVMRRDKDMTSIAVAMVDDNGLLQTGMAGVRKQGESTLVSQNDAYLIKSCTKAMTSFVAAKVVADTSSLDWETPVVSLLTSDPSVLSGPYADISLKHLLSHTAGLPTAKGTYKDLTDAWTNGADVEQEERLWFAQQALLKTPGSSADANGYFNFRYSNEGYVIAGAVLEQVTGESYEQLLRDYIFTPLHMATCDFGPPAYIDSTAPWGHVWHDGADPTRVNPGPGWRVYRPAGGVHCSLADWGRFVSQFLRHETGKSTLLSSDAFDEIETIVKNGYGLGWTITSAPWSGPQLQHNGAGDGFNTSVWVARGKNRAILTATNTREPNSVTLNALRDTAVLLENDYVSLQNP